jgi:hypothetical protein
MVRAADTPRSLMSVLYIETAMKHNFIDCYRFTLIFVIGYSS